MKFWMTLEELNDFVSKRWANTEIKTAALAAYSGRRAQAQLKAQLLERIDAGATIDMIREELTSAATPAAHWEVDPHPHLNEQRREDLCLGQLSDDHLANYAFMQYDVQPSLNALLSGTADAPIVIMTAVKERIRWLSRRLSALESTTKPQG